MRKRPSESISSGTVLVPVLAVRDTVHFPGKVDSLLIARDASLAALRYALKGDRLVLAVSQRDMSVDEPTASDLHRVGTLAKVLQTLPLPDGTMRGTIRGEDRGRVLRYRTKGNMLFAEVELLAEPRTEQDPISIALSRECAELFARLVELDRNLPDEALHSLLPLSDPGATADEIAHHLNLPPASKQVILEALDPVDRLRLVHAQAHRELEILEAQNEIRARVDRELDTSRREFLLREQLRALQAELGEVDPWQQEMDILADKIVQANLPPEVSARANLELDRLRRLSFVSPEAALSRTYLDWLLSVPWSKKSSTRMSLHEAKRILDRDHYGLDAPKDRILDFLAVQKISKSLRGPILCFLGPSGVGKTSLARSIAKSLGRRFVSVSLGGLKDESEIRGHRRTYVGAMPGRLGQGLQQAGVSNPVILLDEIDKMGSDFRGDPAAALLEALDPAQNHRFQDHFLELPVNLSDAFFIATANSIHLLPTALRDRLEIVEFHAYTDEEKLSIAREHLIPRLGQAHGLEDLSIPAETLRAIVSHYTQEAGVRGLTRALETLCRKAVRSLAEGMSVPKDHWSLDNLSLLLGSPTNDFAQRTSQVGLAHGLVVSELGGDTIEVEVALLEPIGAEPEVRLTGNLGDVFRESAQAALTFIRSHLRVDLKRDVHIHLPRGGIPKDGPSAGVTLAVALASSVLDRPVRSDVMMSGEISLRGRVLPVGGIRDKLVAAARSGATTVILPEGNRADVEQCPASLRVRLNLVFISNASQALDVALVPRVVA
ncbi:MAG TPA: endopeptidase La [Fimbriimonadaceae bacterium]|nr:endopeptidase La [Fimbriimonadaceae bacterium]